MAEENTPPITDNVAQKSILADRIQANQNTIDALREQRLQNDTDFRNKVMTPTVTGLINVDQLQNKDFKLGNYAKGGLPTIDHLKDTLELAFLCRSKKLDTCADYFLAYGLFVSNLSLGEDALGFKELLGNKRSQDVRVTEELKKGGAFNR